MSEVILHLSDWNYVDKYYQLPEELIWEFRDRIKRDGMSEAWKWFHNLVYYDARDDGLHKPIKFLMFDDDEYFLDFENPLESVSEWDEEKDDEEDEDENEDDPGPASEG